MSPPAVSFNVLVVPTPDTSNPDCLTVHDEQTSLLCALEFRDQTHSRQLTHLCADKGLLVVPTPNGIIRLLPDLLVSDADIEAALAVLQGVLRGVLAEL